MPGNHTGHPYHTRKNDKELIPVEKTKRVIKVESRKRRKSRKLKMVGYIFCVLPVLLVISAVVAFILYQSNLSQIQKMVDKAMPELWENEDGTYELNWSSLQDAGADLYYVKVGTLALFSENGERTFFSGYVEDVSCHLPELPTDEGLVLEMELIKKNTVQGKERTSKIASIERYFYIRDPRIKKVNWEVDPDVGTAYISLDYQEANSCSIYVMEQSGEKRFLRTVEENSLELNLSEEGLWIPTPGNPCTLMLVPGNCVNGMALYGGTSKELILSWEEFAARDIHLDLKVIDGCVAYLEWNKVDCDSYEIQMRDDDVGVWKIVKTVNRGDECTYVSTRLSPGAGYSFRVAALLEDYAAVSEVQECEIAVTPLYCTVWPVKDLKAYSDAAKSSVVGEVKSLDAQCVVDLQNDMFGIDMNGSVCYIDSNYCLINLPEYVGGLCNYDITNSYFSIYLAHGFEMPGITGETIKGYEHVWLKDNSFLVPLLYPTARKLETAIEDARERGYRLKIYDAFRGHVSSVYNYQTAVGFQYDTLPESTFWGDDLGINLYVQETDEYGMQTVRRKTYWELMNGNNNYSMGSFFNAGVSRHNLGLTLDLTLEYLETGDELIMQTDIHDLSWYSELRQNNENAKLLYSIMTAAGFTGISSEWWHFQDDKAYSQLSLPCVENGVTAECWMANGYGWRYRDVDGTYAVDCTRTIDGIEYTFDSDGYVQNR